MGGQRAPVTVFYGACFICGKTGHSAKNCPAAGKGFTGTCYTCGETGHRASECPKGKGKGINELGSGSEGECESNAEEQGENISAIRFGGAMWAVKKGGYEGKNKFEVLREEEEEEEEGRKEEEECKPKNEGIYSGKHNKGGPRGDSATGRTGTRRDPARKGIS